MRPALGAALVGLLALGVSLPAVAQPTVSASVTMSADRTSLAVGDHFQLTVEARCQGATDPQIQLPSLDAFDVVSRRTSTPFSVRFGFGGAGQQVQSTVRHVFILVARQEGTFELPPAVVELAGQRFESAPLTLTVGGGGPAQPGLPPGQVVQQDALPPPTSQIDGLQFDPGGFVRTWVEPAQPYVGQQVSVSVYLYFPQALNGNPMVTREPTADGFWTQDLLPPSRQLRPERQVVNGRAFDVYLLRRFAAFPLSAGPLTIGPTEVTIESRSLFDVLGMNGRPREPWSRASPPVTVEARELPSDGRPRGPVHVGSLALEASLDRAQIATGDAVTLTLTASGTGAIQQLQLAIPAQDGLRILRPEIRDALSHAGGVVGGTRTYRWLIVPERAGDYTLGPVEAAVLDPATGTYAVARTAALSLTAAGSGPEPTAVTPATTEEPDPADDDARARFGPVRTHSELTRSPTVFSEQPWFLGSLLLGPLALLIGLGYRTARARAGRDDPKAAARRARKAAKGRLAAAREHAAAEAPREFYAAVAAALKDVLEAKLEQPVGSLTHAELRKTLVARGMDEATGDRIVDELEGCDFARFSAVGVGGDEMMSCLERARGLLGEIDRFRPTEVEA